MKTKKLLFVLLIFFYVENIYAQAPPWVWAKDAFAPRGASIQSVTTDASGNIYAVGSFYGDTITFGALTLTISGGMSDLFIVKYDPSGNAIWAKGAGGSGSDAAHSVIVDKSGNIIVCGVFNSDTLIFNSDTLKAHGMFIVKYDSSGNFLWVREASGSYNATSLTTDVLGNIYVAGQFSYYTVYFDKTIHLLNKSGFGTTDIFIVKYDSSGKALWAKGIEGDNDEHESAITSDSFGNFYLSGYTTSSAVDFGASVALSNIDFFICKYDWAGNIQWAKGGKAKQYDRYSSLVIDTSTNIYAVGFFSSDSVIFGSTMLMNKTIGYSLIYL